MSGIDQLSRRIIEDLANRLLEQRRTQRDNLGLLVATMLEARSANLMDLAASLPRPIKRLDKRSQWIGRFLSNDLVDVDEVMVPFAHEVLSRIVGSGQSLVLMIDQTQASVRHQVLMVSVRLGGRALPVAWQARRTSGAIGFSGQRDVLEAVRRLLPEDARPALMVDRFYGSPDLIGRCRAWGWSYRLRLKGKVRATSRARTNTAYRVLAPQFTVAGTAAAIAARVSDTTNPDYSVRHEGARHQWRRDPPG